MTGIKFELRGGDHCTTEKKVISEKPCTYGEYLLPSKYVGFRITLKL